MNLRKHIGLRPVAVAIATGLAAGLAAQAFAAASVYTNDGFGSGDLHSFRYWNVRFGAATTVVAAASLPTLRRWRRGFSTATAIGLGVAIGYAFTYYNWKMLGDWFRAWSFPVLFAWVFGAVVGLLFGITVSRRWIAGDETTRG